MDWPWATGLISFVLPGYRQSVYRAELYAACRALEIAQNAREIISDNKGVITVLTDLQQGIRHAKGKHADLERRALIAMRHDILFRWMPAHTTAGTTRGQQVNQIDRQGNERADAAAKVAVQLHPDTAPTARHIHWCDHANKIWLFLGMVAMPFLEIVSTMSGHKTTERRDAGAKRPREPQVLPKAPRIINAHKVVEHPDFALECLGCRRLIRAHKGYINASYFRRVRCVPAAGIG